MKTTVKRPKDSEWKRLVINALKSGPRTGMKTKEIYDFIERNSSSTSTTPKKKWKGNVRFILSHNSFFTQSPDTNGLWTFIEESHQQKAEKKRLKALDRAKIKAERRNPTTPTNSFAPSNERAAQQRKTYHYPALASAVDIANPGNIRPSAIYAAQSYELATPCYPPANFNQTYNPMLPSCSYVTRFPPCSYAAPPSISLHSLHAGLSESSTIHSIHSDFLDSNQTYNPMLPSCSYVSRFPPCSYAAPPSNSLPSLHAGLSESSTIQGTHSDFLDSNQTYNPMLPSCSYVSRFPPCSYAAPPSISLHSLHLP